MNNLSEQQKNELATAIANDKLLHLNKQILV